MAYTAFITRIKNLRPHPNADRLQMGVKRLSRQQSDRANAFIFWIIFHNIPHLTAFDCHRLTIGAQLNGDLFARHAGAAGFPAAQTN